MGTGFHDLIIIGGGASGLAAAVSYVKAGGEDVLILEAMDECAKKILATGNGRCNLSNVSAEGYDEIVAFFAGLGVLTRADEEGRVYPMSNQAVAIKDALLSFLSGVKIETGKRVDKVVRSDGGFSVRASGSDETWASRKLIVASGGSAAPAFGTRGDSFSLARSLGIEVCPTLPALVPLEYKDGKDSELAVLKGVRAKADASIFFDGEKAGEASGEVQFTRDGISGIVIFDLSRFLKFRKSRDANIVVSLDLAPELSKEAIVEVLKSDSGIGLSGVVNKKLAEYIEGRLPRFARNDEYAIEQAAELLKNFEIEIGGSKGWKEAQVTAGGVSQKEIDPITGQCHKIPELYFTGEALDRDYICGGFNLSNAWLTGIKAGTHAATAG
ncbi:MAG: aminoacetone oxidase family FAD-binding enzyme [Clostridiales Family XIII bacterium]|jgi:predicted Rossmann fold flavoprotein|nr:aminoacetone oxidase family FAD-binding enzyme [Clostridiales Family XIII bacterium]